MGKLYAFWKYDLPPYLLGGEVEEVDKDGLVTIANGYDGMKFSPVKIVPLEKGIKLQKKLDKATAQYNNEIIIAKKKLNEVVKTISE